MKLPIVSLATKVLLERRKERKEEGRKEGWREKGKEEKRDVTREERKGWSLQAYLELWENVSFLCVLCTLV